MIPEGRPKTVRPAQGRWPHAEAQRPGGLVCRPSGLEKVPSRSLEPEGTGPWAFDPRVSSSVPTGLWRRPEPCAEGRGTSPLPPARASFRLSVSFTGEAGRGPAAPREEPPRRLTGRSRSANPGAASPAGSRPLPERGRPEDAGAGVEAPQPGLGRNKPDPAQSRQRFPARASARGASSGSRGDSAQGPTAASRDNSWLTYNKSLYFRR